MPKTSFRKNSDSPLNSIGCRVNLAFFEPRNFSNNGLRISLISALLCWIEIRTLRNKLVHEYMDSAPDLLQALIVALKSSEALTQTQKDLAKNIANLCITMLTTNKLNFYTLLFECLC
jgi:hypothetical protein